jgi:ribosome assembly protein 1
MQQWLPLSTATFQAVVDVIPPPSAAQAVRLPHMLHPKEAAASSTPLKPTNDLENALYSCNQSASAPLIAYIAKMFAVRRSELPEYKPRDMTAEEMRQRGREERERRAALAASGAAAETIIKPLNDLTIIDEPAPIAKAETDDSELLLGFARVFSSTLKRGAVVRATLPKYNAELGPTHPRNAKYIKEATVSDLYVMMGRDLQAVEEVPAGHVCAIAGLAGIVPRSATLCGGDDDNLINLAGVGMHSAPIVRVALEPENPGELI